MGSLYDKKEILLKHQPQNHDNLKCEKIYLDYNGTTPLESEVVESIANALIENWPNPSSRNQKGFEAKSQIEKSRQYLADMINAESKSDIIFVSGGTEANNLVFYSCLKYYDQCKTNANIKNLHISKLPHIIISEIEHDSVKLVAENYERENLAEITKIGVNADGVVEVSDVIDAIKPNTILISIMLANNETGVIQPLRELTSKLNKSGYNKQMFSNNNNLMERYCPLFVHTDAAQAIGKIKVDVNELQVDYLTVVGHKFYGPRIGCLYARNCLKYLSESDQLIENYLEINDMRNNKIAPVIHPFYGASQENGLRPGTENTPMIVGLGKAAQLVTKNLENYSLHMRTMRDYLEKRLEEEFKSENLHFNGRSKKSERLPNTCNVSFIASSEYKGYAILEKTKLLEASTGACCHSGELKPSKILLAMKIDKSIAANAIRLSVGRETTKEQIDMIINDIKTNGLDFKS